VPNHLRDAACQWRHSGTKRHERRAAAKTATDECARLRAEQRGKRLGRCDFEALHGPRWFIGTCDQNRSATITDLARADPPLGSGAHRRGLAISGGAKEPKSCGPHSRNSGALRLLRYYRKRRKPPALPGSSTAGVEASAESAVSGTADMGPLRRAGEALPASTCHSGPLDATARSETVTEEPDAGNPHVRNCGGGEAVSHGSSKRARRWKRRIQPGAKEPRKNKFSRQELIARGRFSRKRAVLFLRGS
jgi:hypothetical protein